MKSQSILIFLALASGLQADPLLTTWYTADSGQYARIYQNAAAQSAGTTSTTWSQGGGVQTSPTYAGISQVSYSTNWVYIRTTGLAGYVMGPWSNVPSFPANNARIYRFPRTPAIPTGKTLTTNGPVCQMVNGVSIFDSRDGFSYSSNDSTDATPQNRLRGDGVWNRDAWSNEGRVFDPAGAHQAGPHYHNHVNPLALRHQLGDHVDYVAATKTYVESSGPVTSHSPILGWAKDGLPVYGPYGYSNPLDANSGVRRMVSGFVPRDGSFGTTNLNTTGRNSLPAWATRIQSVPFRSGPAVTTEFPSNYGIGHYIEDFDYLGDLGYTLGTSFDLNEQNVRWGVTPDYPSGTWAYFIAMDAAGNPAYPYTTGRQYFGAPTGGETTITEAVTIYFNGGPNKAITPPEMQSSGGDITLTWSAVEGGTYLLEASNDLSVWPDIAPAVTAGDDEATFIDVGGAGQTQRFYRLSRTGIAPFDSNGFDYTP